MNILEELDIAVLEAVKKFKEDHNRELEEGDQFVIAFNNASLVVLYENGELKTDIIDKKPYEIDMTLSVYKNRESEEKEND